MQEQLSQFEKQEARRNRHVQTVVDGCLALLLSTAAFEETRQRVSVLMKRLHKHGVTDVSESEVYERAMKLVRGDEKLDKKVRTRIEDSYREFCVANGWEYIDPNEGREENIQLLKADILRRITEGESNILPAVRVLDVAKGLSEEELEALIAEGYTEYGATLAEET